MIRRLIAPTIAAMAGIALLGALGAWQWQRMGQKEALVAMIRSRIAMPAEPLALSQGAPKPEYEYRPTVLRGQFSGTEAHVFFSLAKAVGGFGGAGFLVLAPFKMADGQTILVNRGFVPQPLKAPELRPQSRIEGPAEITGLLRLPEKRGPFSGADDPVKNIYYVRDPDAIARGLGIGPVVPYVLDLQTPAPAGGLPVPNVTQIDIPNNHFQYALTWWSLAAVLAVVFIVFARQQRSAD